jgi:hypothetical protein
MAIFAITFRIHDDAGYSDRYESVVEAIKSQATGNGKYWDEPTSFFLIESSLNSEGVASKIDQSSSFADSKDLLLVTNLTQRGYKAIGNVKDDDLHDLMKKRWCTSIGTRKILAKTITVLSLSFFMRHQSLRIPVTCRASSLSLFFTAFFAFDGLCGVWVRPLAQLQTWPELLFHWILLSRLYPWLELQNARISNRPAGAFSVAA